MLAKVASIATMSPCNNAWLITKVYIMTTYNIYEVYLCNPETGQSGWDIKYIGAPNAEALKTMPHFDCVILKQWTNQTLEEAKEVSHWCDGIVWDGEKFL